jgi:hypothetical protein
MDDILKKQDEKTKKANVVVVPVRGAVGTVGLLLT